jgi:hypothetical protein
MAGKAGKSGRRPGFGKSAMQHWTAGTYRADRHGPLPPGVQPMRALAAVPRRPSAPASLGAELKYLDADDVPAILDAEGKAFWLQLIIAQPVEKIFAQLVCTYCEGWQQWCRATRQIQASGDLVRLNGKPALNPYFKLRHEAEATMYRCAEYLNWAPSVVHATLRPDAAPSRLQRFLDSKLNAKARRR